MSGVGGEAAVLMRLIRDVLDERGGGWGTFEPRLKEVRKRHVTLRGERSGQRDKQGHRAIEVRAQQAGEERGAWRAGGAEGGAGGVCLWGKGRWCKDFRVLL